LLVLRPSVVAQRSPGVVQPTEIKITPEISGRFLRYAVAPGQSVHKGDMLAEFSNPELEATLVPGNDNVPPAGVSTLVPGH
jgi:HlyD family secretion protein